MDENLRKILDDVDSKRPRNLVEKFRRILQGAGVEVQGVIGAKYFAAMNNGRAIIVLAHESTVQGFWGIRHDIVERCQKAVEAKKEELQDWGAALLDESPSRGFWIPSTKIKMFSDSYSGANQQYLFHKPRLEEFSAAYFIGIPDFLSKSGLRVADHRIEI